MTKYAYPTGYNPLNISPREETAMEEQAAKAAQAEEAVEETLLDLDSVEDINFDDIEDAPGFVNPPNGVYDLTVTKAAIETYKTKAREGQPSETRKRFAHYYQIDKVVELEDANEQAPKVGDKFSERFMMNEQGMKFWKSKAKAILGDIGRVTVANVLTELSSGNYSFRARIQNKKSKSKKEGDTKEYTNTQVRVISRGNDPSLEGGQVAQDESVI